MSVNAFALTPNVIAALEASWSPERMATYIRAAQGDRERAIQLYTWNTAASAAFYGPLQGLEVVLRNAMHRSLSSVYGADWYNNPRSGLDAGALNRVAAANADLLREGYVIDPPHVIAALAFGFWVSLLGRGGSMSVAGTAKANYDMTLWRSALHRAFPHARKARGDVHRPLDYLRTFRNRIAHHEPIFARHLVADYASIMEVTGWICPDTRNWMAHHSRVADILALPPDGAALKF